MKEFRTYAREMITGLTGSGHLPGLVDKGGHSPVNGISLSGEILVILNVRVVDSDAAVPDPRREPDSAIFKKTDMEDLIVDGQVLREGPG